MAGDLVTTILSSTCNVQFWTPSHWGMQRGPETQSADGNAWVIWSRHCDCMSEEAAEVELDSNNGGV
jgi:hypothetical protein